jgi:hypothetical protein
LRFLKQFHASDFREPAVFVAGRLETESLTDLRFTHPALMDVQKIGFEKNPRQSRMPYPQTIV